jgi:hypothetical protein
MSCCIVHYGTHNLSCRHVVSCPWFPWWHVMSCHVFCQTVYMEQIYFNSPHCPIMTYHDPALPCHVLLYSPALFFWVQSCTTPCTDMPWSVLPCPTLPCHVLSSVGMPVCHCPYCVKMYIWGRFIGTTNYQYINININYITNITNILIITYTTYCDKLSYLSATLKLYICSIVCKYQMDYKKTLDTKTLYGLQYRHYITAAYARRITL